MNFRQLGKSGLRVPVLCLGTGTFGGTNDFFKKWGSTDVAEARELVDVCMEAGCNFFDTANGYSDGASEEILGAAIAHLPRESLLISTKVGFAQGQAENQAGASRYHIVQQVENSLRRLKTEYIDVYHIHRFDALTPIEETVSALNDLVHSGKVRYLAASNYSGWALQKSLDVADRYGWSRFVAHQVYYSLIGRDYEWELMPQAVEENIGALVWSPLGWGRLTGKIRRGQPPPADTRIGSGGHTAGPVVPDEYLYTVVDALDDVAKKTGKTVPQIALNWLLRKPTIASVVIGARNGEQLRANLEAANFVLSEAQVAALDKASEAPVAYPYWHQRNAPDRNPLLPAYRL